MKLSAEDIAIGKSSPVHVEVSSNEKPEHHKTNGHGIALVPQPSDDPLDPLNWTGAKKFRTLFVISCACLASTLSALANSSGFESQAVLYNKSLTQISYTLCASISGMAIGPFIWIPITKLRYGGRSACIMWSLVLMLLLNVWSTQMTGPNDYIPFTVSRLFTAIAGSGAMILGGDFIVEIFFLHERGRAYAVYSTSTLFGTVAAGTFSGFIVEKVDWPVQYWYNIGFEGLAIAFCLLWLEETGWTRDGGETYPTLPTAKFNRKLVTYFFAGPIMPQKTVKEIISCAFAPMLLAISPVTVLAGSFLTISFGWTVAKQTLLAVYLQTPKTHGGYGFSPQQNAWFTFSNWVAVVIAQIYSLLVNDRLPLWVCKRYGGGLWKPEYRLHAALWIPCVLIEPIGLGLFGACLRYQLHYMLLAFASFLITFSGITSAPVMVNYIVETFRHLPNETIAVMNFYRVALGIAVPFFVVPWFKTLTTSWTFGMMAFLTLLADCFVLVLLIWGPKIREFSLIRRDDSEEGIRVIEKSIREAEI